MIFVALLFLFPVYVLVTLSFKRPARDRSGGLGLPSASDRQLLGRRGRSRSSAPRC